jgi:hypothetical protein
MKLTKLFYMHQWLSLDFFPPKMMSKGQVTCNGGKNDVNTRHFFFLSFWEKNVFCRETGLCYGGKG